MTIAAIYDVEKNEFTETDPLGSSGFMSWHRLAAYLEKDDGTPGEKLTHIVMTERGLALRFKRAAK